MNNVLLVIVDCLRYDRVSAQYMPKLHEWGKRHVCCTNYWVTSHCTDPSITHLLSGKHPDELGLYSMMYDDSSYTIPDTVQMLPQFAASRGYATAFLTNLGRWYRRGVRHYVDVRGWHVRPVMERAKEMVRILPQPWLIIVHTDAMHTNYLGGSYDAAAALVDEHLAALLEAIDEETTMVIVTADHGEGLNQKSVSGAEVEQHGYCLDEFITHVPLLAHFPYDLFYDKDPAEMGDLFDNGSVYDLSYHVLQDDVAGRFWPYFTPKPRIYQAGATPDLFHRGVVFRDASQYITEHDLVDGTLKAYYVARGPSPSDFELADGYLKEHLERCGVDYTTFDEQQVADRLKALGYFD